MNHYETTGHPVSVKLGTITPEGAGKPYYLFLVPLSIFLCLDVYCYTCDDSKEDPAIALHLSNFGINVQSLTKTEKNMTELVSGFSSPLHIVLTISHQQIEENLRYDFSLTDDDGKALEPVFGPGLTGLANLGNSCYMASVLQTIFALPAFQTRYYEPAGMHHAEACTVPLPADCVECQMRKVADGLLSGRYSHPANALPPSTSSAFGDALQHPSPTPVFQLGVKPTTFKTLIGKGHQEFATMRQQDAEEFFTHLLTVLKRDGQKYRDRAEQGR